MCGAQVLFLRQRAEPAHELVRFLVLGVQHGLVRVHVLGHERADPRPELQDFVGRAQVGGGHAVSIASMRLGFYMGYAPPGTSPLESIALAQEAERLGYDSVGAEAWGTDCVTVLSWLGATTRRSSSGARSCRSPVARREHSDDGRDPRPLSGAASARARHLGPQVVEGWHGEPWAGARETREYVEIVRSACGASRRAPR